MTEQPQSRIETAIARLMYVPAAAREAVLILANEFADMSSEERAELERAFNLIKRYAPNKIVRKPEGATPQKRKRGPKPVPAVA